MCNIFLVIIFSFISKKDIDHRAREGWEIQLVCILVRMCYLLCMYAGMVIYIMVKPIRPCGS